MSDANPTTQAATQAGGSAVGNPGPSTFVSASGAAPLDPNSKAAAVQNPGWVEDILGMLAPFVPNMQWRLDLSNYDQVIANGTIIWSQISSKSMPPPQFPPLTDAQIYTFYNWMNNDYPMNRPS